jgi:hypothetical protein
MQVWRLRRRGIKTRWVCRFFTWFWFGRENRGNRWPSKVIEVLGPSTFRVDKGGSRQSVWLRGPGCIGYEYPRQIFIALGEFLRRYRWFQTWNRSRCPKCDHDKFKDRYNDYVAGHLAENIVQCANCLEDVSQFMYGYSENWATNRWQQYEEKIFGPLPKS